MPAASYTWWRRWGSNPRPQACKARALPAELRPQVRQGRLRVIIAPAATRLALGRLFAKEVVGPTRFELVTSRLSAGRSDQLSYGPNARSNITQHQHLGQPQSHISFPSLFLHISFVLYADSGEARGSRARPCISGVYQIALAPPLIVGKISTLKRGGFTW